MAENTNIEDLKAPVARRRVEGRTWPWRPVNEILVSLRVRCRGCRTGGR